MARRRDGEGAPTIEFLAPESSVFGPTGASGSADWDADGDESSDDDREPRSPWLGAITGGIVLAVIGVAVIVAAPWASDDDATTAPTTTVAVSTTLTPAETTAPADSGTLDVLGATASSGGVIGRPPDLADQDRGYIVDDLPEGFTLSFASSSPASAANAASSDTQLWASPGSSRTSGIWLALQTSARPMADTISDRGRRVEVGGRAALVSTSANGVGELRFAPDDAHSAIVDWFGLAEADVIAIAATVTVDDLGTGVIGSSPAGLVDLLHTRSFEFGALGGVEVLALTSYTDTTSGGYVDLRAGPFSDDLPVVLPYVLDDFELLPYAGRTVWRGSVDPAGFWAMQSDSLSHPNVAFFEDQGTLVGLTGNLGDPVLLGLVTSAHRANDDEWTRATAAWVDLPDGDVLPADGGPVTSRVADFERVAGSRHGEHPTWSVEVDAIGRLVQVAEAQEGPFVRPIEPSTPLRVVVSSDLTVVVVATMAESQASVLRVTVGSGAPVDIALTTVLGVVAGGYAFTELGPYTVELLDPTAAVLARATG